MSTAGGGNAVIRRKIHHGIGWIFRRPVDYAWFLAVIFCIFSLQGTFLPSKLPGFRCDDPNIRFTFHGDSISLKTLLVCLLTLPCLLLFIVEVLLSAQPLSSFDLIERSRGLIADYLVGFQLVAAVIETVKCTITELRPHFLDTCKPNWTSINCSLGLVTEYSCTTNETWLTIDIYKSFPSGHAALSFYCFAFLTGYAHRRFRHTRSSSRIIGIATMLIALITSGSRIYDRRHHWNDVLTGAVIGMIGGILTVTWLVEATLIELENMSHRGEKQHKRRERFQNASSSTATSDESSPERPHPRLDRVNQNGTASFLST